MVKSSRVRRVAGVLSAWVSFGFATFGCSTYTDDLVSGELLPDAAVEALVHDGGTTAVEDVTEPVDAPTVDASASSSETDVASNRDAASDTATRDVALPVLDAPPVADEKPAPIVDAAGDTGSHDSGCNGGYAVQFNGNAYGAIKRLVQDDFTIELWMKMTSSLIGTEFWQGSSIAFADNMVAGANDFALTVLNDKLAFGTGNPDTTALSTTSVATGASNRWMHVAATRTRATGRIAVYVNGVLENSATGGTTSLTAFNTVGVGGQSHGNLFVGYMDEFRMWKTVRTPTDIVANMHKRMKGDEAGLVTYYRFDENGGTKAIDSSPSLNHAAFTGPVTWVPSDAPICE